MFDYQIACAQKFGGISRYHYELLKGLNRCEKVKARMPLLFTANYYFSYAIHGPGLWHRKIWKKLRLFNKIYMFGRYYAGRYDIFHWTWYDDANCPKGGKTVVTIHDMIHELMWQDQEQDLIRRKKELIYKADYIIAISQNTKWDILRLYPDIPENKISVIYHGTNHLPVPRTPEGWDTEMKYILFVGKRNLYKNGMIMVREIGEILKRDRVFLFFAGGDGLQEDELQVIREAGIENLVIQKNVSDGELAFLYQNAVCFIYPSGYEGFGFPLLEAFDNGCPVLCNHATSLPEVGGDAVMYFDININGDLKEKLDSFLQDENLRQRLINDGRKRCQQFNWDKTAKETLKVYRKLSGKN